MLVLYNEEILSVLLSMFDVFVAGGSSC